jgi:hypothetical protein
MMTGTFRVRRSRGALSGALLVLLGIWGALIPFVGPYFHYAYQPDRAWTSTSGRIWLEVLPGAVTLAAGLVVLASRLRPFALLGAWLAALAGAWFAVGDVVGGHFSGIPGPGTPAGGTTRAVLEQLGFFTGLGVVIVFMAAVALGRFSVVSAKDAVALGETTEPEREAVGAGAGGTVAATAAAAGTGAGVRQSRRRPAIVTPVPVFRGRQRAATQQGDD